MAFRRAHLVRALVAAPVAVLLAAGAHAVGFGGDHVLGGAHAGALLGIALAGCLGLAAAALVWVALARPDVRRAEAALLGLLPARGGVAATAAVLGGSGFAAFAFGELLEGHSPFGTATTLVALVAIAALSALGAQRFLRSIAACGVALAVVLGWVTSLTAPPQFAPARSACPSGFGHIVCGRHDGRAPPRIA